MNEWVLTRAAALGCLILVACGPKTSGNDEPTTSDLAALAENNVERALRGTVRAGGFVAESATLAGSLGFMGGESCTDQPCVNGVCPPSECVPEPVTVDDLRQSREDMNASIDSLMKTLREKIFTKENLESENDGGATYRLGPKSLCGSDGDEASPGSSSGAPAPPAQTDSTLDPDCVDLVNRLEVRLRLSSAGADNVNVALLLTPEKRNPATLELYADHVGVVVNLGEIKGTLDALGEDTGSLVSLVGKLDFELKRNAELDYSFLASVLEDVKVGVRQDSGETLHVGIGKSIPTFELRFDGNARTVKGTLDVGAITLDGPLNAFRDVFDQEEYDASGNPIPRPTYQGALEGTLAGIEAGVTLDGSNDELTLDHVGLGDVTSTLKIDQNVVAALDVNPNAGRHFDLALQKQDGGTLATFMPTLDVSVLLKFAPLLAQIPDLSPAVLDNTLHLWFDGTNPSIQTGSEKLRVVSGTLHYTDAHDPSHDVTAAAGSCIATSDAAGSAGIAVTACQ